MLKLFQKPVSWQRGSDTIYHAVEAWITSKTPGSHISPSISLAFALLAFLGCVLASVMTRLVAAAAYYGNPAVTTEVEYLNVAAPHDVRVVIFSSALRGFS